VSRRGRAEQPEFVAAGDGLGAVDHVELLDDGGDVGLGRAGRDSKQAADLVVGEAFPQERIGRSTALSQT